MFLYSKRVGRLREKFGSDSFRGSLRLSAQISAYMDNHEDPRFAMLRLCTKGFIVLGFLQIRYHLGFLIMVGMVFVESSLDSIRILLAYLNCRSLRTVSAIADDEAHDMRDATKLEPTNVYEDFTRPRSIATMVFMVQVLLVSLVMYDTYATPTRPCFDRSGTACPMLESLGSYILYLVGMFMACVFYVGPSNSYGQKEQNPTFWLKLFLLTKESSKTFWWRDKSTDHVNLVFLEKADWRIWARFLMSFIINGFGFHFLIHMLPIQVASQSSAMGVVFRAVGMIYLTDLDDAVGNTMTLIVEQNDKVDVESNENRQHASEGSDKDYGSNSTAARKELDAETKMIIDESVQNFRTKLETLASSDDQNHQSIGKSDSRYERRKTPMHSITSALYYSVTRRRKEDNSNKERTPLNP